MYKSILIAILLMTLHICHAQNIIRGSLKTVIFKTGSTKESVLKLANAERIDIKFKSYFVEVSVTSKSSGQNLLSLEENDEWKIIQVSEFDFEKDGIGEIVIAYGDGLTQLKLLVFKKNKNKYQQIGKFEGIDICELSKNRITFPYGSQGLFIEYLLKKGQFTQTN